MKVLILGDTHARAAHIRFALQKALELGCEQIIQLGDFGYFPHLPEGRRFLDLISDPPIPIYWLDGNHEDHDSLNHAASEPVEVAPNIFYLPRGYCWKLGDLKVLALGGAYSIDKDQRILGHTYFEQETIAWADIRRSVGAGQVDLLLSHDCPIEVDLNRHLNTKAHQRGRFPISDNNRQALQIVVKEVCPSYLIHGHHHQKYSARLPLGHEKICLVQGLHCNQNFEESWLVLDTDQLKNDIFIKRGMDQVIQARSKPD